MINWNEILRDIQLIASAMIFHNSLEFMERGFSWLGLAGTICGFLLVGLTLYIRNGGLER